MASRPIIRVAGEYLLSILKTERAVNYGRFYNLAAYTNIWLANDIWPFLEAQPVADRRELKLYDREDLEDYGHMYIMAAAWQLDDYGAVRVTFTDATLHDGGPDCLIELTERGGELISGAEVFRFRSPGSGFDASRASRWLIDFADDSSNAGSGFQFDTVVQAGHTDGDVKVTDEGENEYPPGTRPYDRAFEVSLWHHVRCGHIELLFASDDQKQVWTAFLAKYPDLSRHAEFPGALRGVSYRLTPAALADVDSVQHVGWI